VQSSSQIITINKPTSSFYRPGALPVAQPTVSDYLLTYLLRSSLERSSHYSPNCEQENVPRRIGRLLAAEFDRCRLECRKLSSRASDTVDRTSESTCRRASSLSVNQSINHSIDCVVRRSAVSVLLGLLPLSVRI